MSPKVSVCLIAYNHEKYIKQCLDGILCQQVNFDFEIVIGEDKSKDNTLAIIKEYQKNHPDIILVLESERNVGMVANWERTLMACKGKYIAIIEGDDCWISDSKLQKQVDMLDRQAEYSLTFHGVELEFEDGVLQEDPLAPVSDNEELSIKDVILRNWFIPTCSIMIRANALSAFPSWTRSLQAIDMVVQLMVTMHGNIGYINEKMGRYRIHAAGISQMQWLGKANKLQLAKIEIFKHFDAYSRGKYKEWINMRLERGYRTIMRQNPPRSKAHLKALANVVAINPSKNISLIKDWTIINLIPQKVYKIYRPEK